MDSITTKELEDLAAKIHVPPSHMKQIAITCFKIDEALTEKIFNESKDNNWQFNLNILTEFVNNNDTPRKKLLEALLSAAQAGLLTDYSKIETILRTKNGTVESPELTDEMLLKVSERITDEEELFALVVNALQMSTDGMKLFSNGTGVSQAALSLFQMWRSAQTDKRVAYQKLREALESSNLEFFIPEVY